MVNGFTCATMGICPLSAMAFPLFFLRHPRRPLKLGVAAWGVSKEGEKRMVGAIAAVAILRDREVTLAGVIGNYIRQEGLLSLPDGF